MAAPTVGTTITRTLVIEGRPYAIDEIPITFDASSDACSLVLSASNAPSLAGGQFASGAGSPRMVWLWGFMAKNTSATDTFVPFMDVNSRRLVTLDATSATNGHCTTGNFERSPLPFEASIGTTLTIDKGETGSAGAGTITLRLGPTGVM